MFDKQIKIVFSILLLLAGVSSAFASDLPKSNFNNSQVQHKIQNEKEGQASLNIMLKDLKRMH